MTATDSSKTRNRCTIYREHPAFFPSSEMQDRVALNVHVKTDGSHSALGLLVQLFQLLLLVEVRALNTLGASAKFSAQSELNGFFGFFRPAVADENGRNLFFFSESCGMHCVIK